MIIRRRDRIRIIVIVIVGVVCRIERIVRDSVSRRFGHEFTVIAMPQRVLERGVLELFGTQELLPLLMRRVRVRIDVEQNGPEFASLARLAATLEDALLQVGQVHDTTVRVAEIAELGFTERLFLLMLEESGRRGR